LRASLGPIYIFLLVSCPSPPDRTSSWLRHWTEIVAVQNYK